MERIRFKYNDRIYYPKNPEKKLKQLGITWDDVEIIEQSTKETTKEEEEYIDPHRFYYFINPKTGYSISSIYPVCNEDGYEPTTIEYLEEFWRRTILNKGNSILKELTTYIKQIEKNNLENNQEFLSFLDKLNEISVCH